MSRILFAWIGITDLKASKGELPKKELGPIGQVIVKRDYDQLVLLGDHAKVDLDRYKKWLITLTKAIIEIKRTKLTSPTDFGDIYSSATEALTSTTRLVENPELTFHLSPGTPAMAAVWILLAKTRFPAELIESSLQGGVNTASVPFDISAEFIPDLFRKPDEALQRLTAGLPPEAPEFEQIIHQSGVMQKAIARARRVAPRSIPVLIEGESGTGKELFARAIHQSSPRKEQPFISVNCGAIPSELVESMLFGHKKGAFTGAIRDHIGYFETSHRGTLFLDEIGELPLAVQVRLLRVIQEGEIVPVGATEPRKIDVRIITATNRTLAKEVQDQTFREDLYYRVAVAVIRLPPLREREGDLGLLIDRLLEIVNQESKLEPGYKHKIISAKAKNLMLKHSWPGNVRELLNVIRSAAIWSDEATISEQDLTDSLLASPPKQSNEDQILHRDLSEPVDLKEIIADVARHYLSRALTESQNNKTRAAELLGLGNYQTLSNWIEKYGLEK